MVRSAVAAWVLVLATAAGASAQAGISGTSTEQNASGREGMSSSDALKPATTTFLGDTGLWFVPTAEVLASGNWSVSGYRRGTNYVQGFSNVGDFAGTVAYGIGDRAEVFGSFLFDTRVDRDLRPIFTGDQRTGGIVDRYPRINSPWSGDNVGDLNIGAKVSLLPAGIHPVALAARGVFKAPTGDEDAGVSTGKPDFLVDLIASKELRQYAEVSGYAGYEWRGKPDDIDIPGGAFRWGVGAGIPSRGPLRAQLELIGLVPSSDTATITGAPIIGSDLTVSPLISSTEKITRANVGLTWQHSSGFFVGGGVSWNVPRESRDLYQTDSSPFADFVDWQVRIGFHPGARPTTYVPRMPEPPPAPEPAAAPAPEPAPPVRQEPPPVVQAPPPAPAPPVRNYTFEDVYFDFDRYSLRSEATRVLDEAVNALKEDSNLHIEIEGHTCNIGTAEYNLALGDRRANSVRDYLVSRGVSTDRLRTISYGEERPKYDNAREETRRLNRRAALVVNVR
jgi:peptidoglycan-associated lipoprotein